MTTKEIVERFTKRSADEGRIIADGWLAFRAKAIPAEASELQIGAMALAFFSGAQHLWGSIMTMLEAGAEPTPKDLERMDLINRELNDVYALLKGQVHGDR